MCIQRIRSIPMGLAISCGKKNHRQHRQTESSPVSPADVIGKPCETKTDMAKQVNEEENQVLQSHLMIFLGCVSEYRGCECKSIIKRVCFLLLKENNIIFEETRLI